MREHKYKAYIDNPIHGTGIFDVKSINFHPLVVTVIIPNGKYIDNIELTDEVQFFEGEVKLLEYIGKEDKKGNELYENDLVLYRNKTWQIVFIDSAFLLKDLSSKCTEYLKHEYTHWSKTEKINSIYENKEFFKN